MKTSSFLKQFCLIGILTAATLAVSLSAALAEEARPTGDVSASVLNRYVWRGYELSRNSIVVQPSLTVGYKGFTANLWGNLDTKPYSPAATDYTGTWNETDLTLSYSKLLGLFTVGAGYIYCSLAPMNKDAADRNDSQELSATVSLNTLLTPTLTIYREFDHYRNWYALLGISHLIELGPSASLKLAASAGYLLSTDADTYPKYDGNAVATTEKFGGFHDGTVSASLPIKVTEYVTVTPMISYIFPLTSEAKDEIKGSGLKGTLPAERDSAFVVGGITASFTF
jgi:hypothetical protein